MDFVVITEQNLGTVAAELEAGKGRVLIANPHYFGSPSDKLTGEFEMYLFDKPRIRAKDQTLFVVRGKKEVRGENWQTEWEKDRQYRLHPVYEKRRSTRKDDSLHKELAALYGKPANLDELFNRARSLFCSLNLGRYEFEIGFQSIISCGVLNSTERSFFIPRSQKPDAAFFEALMWMTRLWNNQANDSSQFRFNEDHIRALMVYILEDLRTGKVFNHNVQAGVDADVLCGF